MRISRHPKATRRNNVGDIREFIKGFHSERKKNVVDALGVTYDTSLNTNSEQQKVITL